MKVALEELVRRVLLLLGEDDERLARDVDYGLGGISLRSFAADRLPEISREVLRQAPRERLEEDPVALSGLVVRDEGGHMITVLPENYLRFLYLRMPDWDSGIRTLLDPGGELCSLRRCRTFRNRNLPTHKGAVLLPGRRLEIFGTAARSPVELYIIADPVLTDGMMEIPRPMVDPVIEACAAHIRSHLENETRI